MKKVVRRQGRTRVPSRRHLEAEWKDLCARYLPVTSEDSIWRFSRAPFPRDPEQGWKLHLSATIISANLLFKKVAPLLSRSGVLFKGPRTIEELSKINSGLHHGFSQVGKFLTVYPESPGAAVVMARKLHRLTRGIPGPAVPYDQKFKEDGCVYYRYGLFGSIEMEQDNRRVSAVRMPDGTLVPDRREPGAAVPSWVADPFVNGRPVKKPKTVSPLMTTIRAYHALSQRGKGGVYRALDLGVAPARLCVLKEGRRHGETDYFERDGYWRVKHEERVLAALRRAGIAVPKIYQTFEVEGHYYLVTELIEGDNLQTILSRRRRRLSGAQTLQYAIQIAKLVRNIHAAGWLWRDCKPLNLIIARDGKVRPVDFEGACPILSADPTPWGTPGYTPLSPPDGAGGSRVSDDLYALGATLHHLFTGRRPSVRRPPVRFHESIRGLPSSALQITNALLDHDPGARPSARKVFTVLAASSR